MNFISRRIDSKTRFAQILKLYRFRTYDAHTRLDQVEDVIPHNELANSFKFCVVRNPYARLVSFYHHILAHSEHPWHRKVSDYDSFKDLALNLADVQEPTQTSYITLKNGEVGIDYIARLESITKDFARICDQLGVNESLPHKNSHKHNDWREYYDDQTRKAVLNYYSEDFDTFAYTTKIH